MTSADPIPKKPSVIVVMGVAGSGKTTIGELLAARLCFKFADADAFHSDANREKMAHGHPLTDADRMPWLEAMRAAIAAWIATGDRHVLACSALKHSYRDMLRVQPDAVLFVYLNADAGLVQDRLEHRRHHYMKADMIPSQFETLEAPAKDEALWVDASKPPQQIVDYITSRLDLATCSS